MQAGKHWEGLPQGSLDPLPSSSRSGMGLSHSRGIGGPTFGQGTRTLPPSMVGFGGGGGDLEVTFLHHSAPHGGQACTPVSQLRR